MGVEECDASLAAALAGGWHVGGHASAHSGCGRGKRDDSVGVWRRGWRFFPLERVAARASPAAGRARAASAPVSPRGTGCRERTGPRQPTGMNAPRWCHGWMQSRSARANGDAPANASRSSRRIKAMMRKRCARPYASGESGHNSPSVSGRRRKIVADRSKRGATVPSGADVCLVSEEISPFGGPVGMHCGML